ncbi:MAG: hypothetical protein MUF34_38160, partial [Polyangiaceae bacterium]|nr:hypothetical protein [Polyangiaceae bacterium]
TIRCGLDVSFPVAGSEGTHARSTLDLVALRPDGSALVVGLRAAGAAGATGGALLQGAQAYGLRRAFGFADVGSTLVVLGAPRASPADVSFGPDELDAVGERLGGAAVALLQAAAEGTFAARERRTCQALGCAYLAFCHRGAGP